MTSQPYLVPRRSVFNKVVTDKGFELEFAGSLDACEVLVSFAKNPQRQPSSLRIEYQTAEGGLANYYPDFLVKETEADTWVIETKGREDVEDAGKWERLCQWCEDATAADGRAGFGRSSCRGRVEEDEAEELPVAGGGVWGGEAGCGGKAREKWRRRVGAED